MARTRAASASLMRSFPVRGSTSYPKSGRPPTHLPWRRVAAILSRVLSAMSSRSNWAKDKSTFRIRRPTEVVVQNCCVIDTKATWC
jgi:hypothetical protein